MGGALGAFIGPRFRPGLMNGDHHNRKGQSYKVFEIASALGMKENDVHRLWGSFCDSDVTGAGILQVDEFLIMQKLDGLSDFGTLCFKVFDLDGSGYLSFEEYIIVMWNLLTLDDTSLPLFAFRIFDADNSGVLNRDELLECVKIVCGGSKVSMDIALQFAMENDRDKDGFISFVEFERMTYRSKLLMFPAFQIIAALHERIQGASFWRRLTQRRNERYPRMFLLDIIESLSVKPEGYSGALLGRGGTKLMTQKVMDAPIRRKKMLNDLEQAHDRIVDQTGGNFIGDGSYDEEEGRHKKFQIMKHKAEEEEPPPEAGAEGAEGAAAADGAAGAAGADGAKAPAPPAPHKYHEEAHRPKMPKGQRELTAQERAIERAKEQEYKRSIALGHKPTVDVEPKLNLQPMTTAQLAAAMGSRTREELSAHGKQAAQQQQQKQPSPVKQPRSATASPAGSTSGSVRRVPGDGDGDGDAQLLVGADGEDNSSLRRKKKRAEQRVQRGSNGSDASDTSRASRASKNSQNSQTSRGGGGGGGKQAITTREVVPENAFALNKVLEAAAHFALEAADAGAAASKGVTRRSGWAATTAPPTVTSYPAVAAAAAAAGNGHGSGGHGGDHEASTVSQSTTGHGKAGSAATSPAQSRPMSAAGAKGEPGSTGGKNKERKPRRTLEDFAAKYST